MTSIEAILLGFVQGITEFLPVSSSGHLAFFTHFLGITEEGLLFEVLVHFATLLAVVFYFRTTLRKLQRADLITIVVASVPAAMIGLLFEDAIAQIFGSVIVVAALLFLTGALNIYSGKILRDREQEEEKTMGISSLSWRQAFIIGLFQAMAILPGVSRSGSTVAGALSQGIDKKTAFQFSFIMVIPVIAGATLLQLIELAQQPVLPAATPLLLGCLVAFVTGLASLRLLDYMIARAHFAWFGIYCFIVGTVVLLA